MENTRPFLDSSAVLYHKEPARASKTPSWGVGKHFVCSSLVQRAVGSFRSKDLLGCWMPELVLYDIKEELSGSNLDMELRALNVGL